MSEQIDLERVKAAVLKVDPKLEVDIAPNLCARVDGSCLWVDRDGSVPFPMPMRESLHGVALAILTELARQRESVKKPKFAFMRCPDCGSSLEVCRASDENMEADLAGHFYCDTCRAYFWERETGYVRNGNQTRHSLRATA